VGRGGADFARCFRPGRPSFQPDSRDAHWSFERSVKGLDKAIDALGVRTPFPQEDEGEGEEPTDAG
jgi:hypothetical protein